MGIGVTHHASADLNDPVFPFLSEKTKITLHGQSHTEPNRMTVHRRHNEFPDPKGGEPDGRGGEGFKTSALGDVEGLSRMAHVSTGAESTTVSRHHNGSDVVIFVTAPIKLRQLFDHFGADGIHTVWPIQGDQRDTVSVELEKDRIVLTHSVTLARFILDKDRVIAIGRQGMHPTSGTL